jgi:carboxylesterase
VPLDPTAAPYVSEGDPDRTGGRRVGVLLCHGFTGSPASMRPWAEHLTEQGYAVAVPRLPGHGTSWQELNRTGWSDWYAEVERAFEKLRADCELVVVGGLSMGGGLALALAAAHGPDVAGVVLVNAAVANADRRLLALPVLKHLVPSLAGLGNDIKKEGVDEHGYDRTPLRALAALVTAWRQLREDLPKDTQPILLFRSAEDHVVDPSSARIIRARVSSRDVTERVLHESYHVATLDNDAPAIFAESTDFVRKVTGP